MRKIRVNPFVSVALLLTGAMTAAASTRLTYLINQKPIALSWASSAFPIRFEMDRTAVRTLPDGQGAIQRSFQAWADTPETVVGFQPAGLTDGAAGKDGRNIVTLNADLFKNSGFIAYTTTWFDDNGKMEEADIQIDPSIVKEGFNVQNVIQHEVGHFLGLDHSAVVSATMYPYVVAEGPTPLDSDDLIAVASLYPKPSLSQSSGVLRGSVRSVTGPIFGAQVVALNDQGTPVASALTNSQGAYEITGVPEGQYKVYVEPLDGPVDARNLSGVWREAKTGFRTEFGRDVTVKRGGVYSGLDVQTSGAPASLNPRWVGVFPAGSNAVSLGSTVTTIKAGDTISIAIGGEGFISGMTQFEVLNAGVVRVSDFQYGANYTWADFKVAPQTPPGPLVIVAKSGNESATLTGGVRVEAKGAAPRRRAALR